MQIYFCIIKNQVFINISKNKNQLQIQTAAPLEQIQTTQSLPATYAWQ